MVRVDWQSLRRYVLIRLKQLEPSPAEHDVQGRECIGSGMRLNWATLHDALIQSGRASSVSDQAVQN